MKVFSYVKCFLGILLSVYAQGCRNGWMSFDNNCYIFVEIKSSWAEAVTYCKTFGGKLVEVETTEEEKFLENSMKNIHHGLTHTQQIAASYWIAANDIETEGRYIWASNQEPVSLTDWQPGEPNQAGHNEDCVELSGMYGYRWNDRHCDDRIHFICEREDMSGENIIG